MSSFTTPRAPMTPLSRTRRRAAVGTVAVTALLGVLAGIAAWNPWGYVRLGSGLYWIAGGVVLVPLAAGVVAVLLVRAKAAVIAIGVVAGVVTLIAACGGAGVALWASRDWKRAVLATSPSGDYQVVSLTEDTLTWRQELHVARPDGILTRESTRPLTCVQAVWNDHPKVRVTSAVFVAEHEVAVTLDNGGTVRVPFDPGSLQPAQTLDSECRYTGSHVRRLS